MDHRERFSLRYRTAEIVKAQVALCHFHLKFFLLLHAIRMPDAFAHNVADGPLCKIDNERTTATKLSASVSGKPTLVISTTRSVLCCPSGPILLTGRTE